MSDEHVKCVAALDRALFHRDAANRRADAAEARVRELEAAARALLDALPRCEFCGHDNEPLIDCPRLATSGYVETVRCGEHNYGNDDPALPWAESAEALRRLVGP